MKKNITKPKANLPALFFYGYLVLFVAIGILLANTWYRFQINPDATSYISIAQKYATFDFRHAVNGYWAPLLSWLLVPFIWFHMNPLIACKVIAIITSAITLWLFRHLLLNETKLSKNLSLLFALGLSPVLLVWSLPGPITPDLLFVAVLLGEITMLLKALRGTAWRNIICTALLGAILYYTKAIGFYVFIIQVIAILGYKAFNDKALRHSTMLGLKIIGIFIVFTLPFIITISLKYHQPTISTASSYNHGILSPASHGIPIHPLNVTGPFAPPNSTAYSAWEDPSFLPTTHWSVFGSSHNFTYFLSLVYNNLLAVRDDIISLGALVSVGFIVLLAYTYRHLRMPAISPMLIGFTTLLLIGGYSLVVVETRYLWAIAPFALFALALLYAQKLSAWPVGIAAVYLFVVCSFWVNIPQLTSGKYVGREAYERAALLAPVLPTNSKVLSSEGYGPIYDCFYDNLRCYGTIAPSDDPGQNAQLFRTIRGLGIQYFIDPGNMTARPALNSFIEKHATLYKTVHGINIFRFQ